MPVPTRHRRRWIAVLVATGLVLSGCTLGQPASFRGRAEDFCAAANRRIDGLGTPISSGNALSWSSDRYQAMELLVSQITDDVGRPDGEAGHEIDTRWLDPARASLRQGATDMRTLRSAVLASGHDPDAAVVAAFDRTRVAGTVGVDLDVLRQQGYAQCLTSFSTSDSPTLTVIPTSG